MSAELKAKAYAAIAKRGTEGMRMEDLTRSLSGTPVAKIRYAVEKLRMGGQVLVSEEFMSGGGHAVRRYTDARAFRFPGWGWA